MDKIGKHRPLASGFLSSSEQFAERPALEVEGRQWTYAELRERATSIAATLQREEPGRAGMLGAVLANRSATAFSGILGTLLAGNGYVPLNPNFPPDRLVNMLERSGCRTIIVGSEAVATLREILRQIRRTLTIVLPDSAGETSIMNEFPDHRFLNEASLAASDEWVHAEVGPDDIAYLLFTSGSTGEPKGVPIAHSNIRHFIDVMVERYGITEHDRFSQMFELVFDLSLFDLFVAWEQGACVCCPDKGDAQLPARYLRDSRITVWFSVPSLALAMNKMRMLRPDYYPDLRVSLFCGEALLNDICEAWSVAASNSIIENLYGPTEVTLACTLYRWTPEEGPRDSENGLVPIGQPYPGMSALVVDENLCEVPPGKSGELLMCGPQVAPGYWEDANKTAAAFAIPPGTGSVHYRTGDLVRRPPTPDEPIKYQGRLDHQIKIRGNRVELGEVEAVLRQATGAAIAVALGWPRTATGADGIVAFLTDTGADFDSDRAKDALAVKLPSYMVPRELAVVDQMPLNPNGKVDRKALLRQLERGLLQQKEREV